MREARRILGKPEKSPLHFCELKHPERVVWSKACSGLPIRSVSVIIHKKSLDDQENYTQNKYLLYRYASRLLMERVSWLCEAYYNPKSGDGIADITFSNRRRMSYEEIRDYWAKLKGSSPEKDIRINWRHIDPCRMSAVNHDQLAGLQIADCFAASHFQAVNLNRYNNSEPRYLSEIKGLIYKHKGKTLGYGLKFWPALEKLRPSHPHLEIFDGL